MASFVLFALRTHKYSVSLTMCVVADVTIGATPIVADVLSARGFARRAYVRSLVDPRPVYKNERERYGTFWTLRNTYSDHYYCPAHLSSYHGYTGYCTYCWVYTCNAHCSSCAEERLDGP